MDKKERSRLLLQQEQLGKQIEELRAALQHAGRILMAMGAALANSPENTTFANAPPPLGHMPLHLMHSKPLDWNSISDKNVVAQKIQELRALHEQLAEVRRHLKTSA